MPRRISASSRRIPVSNLSPGSFAPFGEVVQNPRTHNGEPALRTVEANQGSATKWLDVSHMENLCSVDVGAQKGAKCVMNMFVCRPRRLKAGRLFSVGILERHPYTPQTFVPMGLGREDKKTAYLVIVAPTLPLEKWHDCDLRARAAKASRPALKDYQYDFDTLTEANKERLMRVGGDTKGRGPPDLANLKAFVARGDQAVTYGPCTWHAPMVVLGEGEIEFVVVQYANGVPEDDCQEVEIVVGDGGDGVEVDVGGELGTIARL